MLFISTMKGTLTKTLSNQKMKPKRINLIWEFWFHSLKLKGTLSGKVGWKRSLRSGGRNSAGQVQRQPEPRLRKELKVGVGPEVFSPCGSNSKPITKLVLQFPTSTHLLSIICPPYSFVPFMLHFCSAHYLACLHQTKIVTGCELVELQSGQLK